ncbi:dynamin family protein [Bdellovibrionota bacterium FG-2]
MSLLNRLRTPGATQKSNQVLESNLTAPESGDDLKILIAGEVNAGKSSFINALMGEAILPAKLSGHTAAIHHCNYSDRKYCSVYFKDDALPPRELAGDRASLEAFMDEGGKDVRYIELGHEMIPRGVVLIDTPGINDPDPYRDSLVTAFMADSDALLFIFDINTPLKATEVEFLNGHLKKYRLSACLFLANKVDIDFAGRDLAKTHNQFLEMLHKYVSSEIQPEQAILVSAKATPDTDPDGRLSPQNVVAALNGILSQKVDLIAKRHLKRAYTEKIKSIEHIRALHSRLTQDQQGLQALINRYLARGRSLLAMHNELQKDRHKFLEDVSGAIDAKFKALAIAIAPLLDYPPDQFERSASEMVAKGVEDIKEFVSRRSNRSACLIALGDLDLASLSAEHQAKQFDAHQGHAERSADSAVLQQGAGLAATAAIYVLHLNPIIGLAIMGFSLLKSRAHAAESNEMITDFRNDALQRIQSRLANARNEILEYIVRWYDDLCVESERVIKNYLIDFLSITSAEPNSDQNPVELARQITILESECKQMMSEYGGDRK